jgi:hypothetical protein
MNCRCHFLISAAIASIMLSGLRADAVNPVDFRVAGDPGRCRVEILSNDTPALSSPTEGLWSIATDWRDNWPADWHHARATQVERVGEWTVLKGTLDVGGGTWHLRDAYRLYRGLVQCVRRYEWKGPEAATKCTLSVRYVAGATGAAALLPGILYYGNPSGARSGRVPVFSGRPGEEALFEEHRYPMPFASIEYQAEGGLRGAALHSLPSPTPYGNVRDQWWSLGVVARDKTTELQLLSGPCASNGRRNVIKAIQPGFVPYGPTYLNVAPGAIIEKTFFLEAYPVGEQGSGFRTPVRTSLSIFEPYGLEGLPTFSEIVRAKYRYARTRWAESGDMAGFRKFPDRNVLVMGWCGQADSLGYALQVLDKGLGDPSARDRAQRSLDTLTKATFYKDGFRTWYDLDKKTWSGTELVSQGQAMLNFAQAIRVGRQGGADTARWEAFLRKACQVHADRILSNTWRPFSTNEGFLIAPLCRASELFGEPRLRQAAIKAGRTYAERHVSMREPYWGGTLDASCEDKEGAYAAMQGFLALQELTHEPEYLRWAEHACDVVLTYVVVWDVDLPPGRLRDHRFRTTGWTAVSPQNQHVDVFGVIIAPEIYRLGRILKRDDLQRLAIVMYRSCGQLIDPYGSQGEQPQHTNYAQRGKVDDVFALRGGYAEDWTVFWITAHFLNAAAQFQEMGVQVK